MIVFRKTRQRGRQVSHDMYTRPRSGAAAPQSRCSMWATVRRISFGRRTVCRGLTLCRPSRREDERLRLWWRPWQLLLFVTSCKLYPWYSPRENVQQTQVREVRCAPLEADQPAGEMFLQPGFRVTGGVGSRAVPLDPYSFHAYPFPLFDLPERL